jgi:hypothetical protein
VMGGMALPAVPLSDVVSSYFYELLADGRWVNRSDRAVLRLEVSGSGATVSAMQTGVMVNGKPLMPGALWSLSDGDELFAAGTFQRYSNAGFGYCGLMLSDTQMRLGVSDGQTAELGREPNHPGLALPDRRGQDNIRWCSGARSARARGGGFTLDRALAGRRQVAIRVVSDAVQVTPLHQRCPTYIVRASSGEMERAEGMVTCDFDDLVVAGTTVVALRMPQ